MLYIKNKENLKAEMLLRHTTDGYSIEGVYEYGDHYQIHIRSKDKTIVDESLILMRNKAVNLKGYTYNYYTLYNSNEPQRRLNITKQMIGFKDMFLHSIETILKMKN
jgi:hypothetical protein